MTYKLHQLKFSQYFIITNEDNLFLTHSEYDLFSTQTLQEVITIMNHPNPKWVEKSNKNIILRMRSVYIGSFEHPDEILTKFPEYMI